MVTEFLSVLGAANSALDLINNTTSKEILKRGELTVTTQGSITKLVSETVIEPQIIVSRSLQNDPIIDKLIGLEIDIFAAYFSQAFKILVDLKGFDSTLAFDVLHSGNKKVSLESGYIDNGIKYLNQDEILMESKGLPINPKTSRSALESEKGKPSSIPTIYSKDIDLKFKLKTVDNEGKPQFLVIPILIKANVRFIDFREIKDRLFNTDFRKSFSERWVDWRAGLITTKNFLTADDLIEEYRQQKIKDYNDLLKYISGSENTGMVKLATTGVYGFGSNYGGLIINPDELRELENEVLRGKISVTKNKDKLLSLGKLMTLTILDKDYDMVSIYTKDIEAVSVFKTKTLSKDKSNDLENLFKDLLLGRQLNF